MSKLNILLAISSNQCAHWVQLTHYLMCNTKIDSENKHTHNEKLQNLLAKTAIKLCKN